MIFFHIANLQNNLNNLQPMLIAGKNVEIDSNNIIRAQFKDVKINDLSDCVSNIDDFSNSILLGTTDHGILSNAINNIGIGSDLCLNQPDEVVEWMRNGTWSKNKNYGEGSKNKPGFPKQPNWFEDARGFKNLEAGLKKVGFSETETNGILGNNWYNFYKTI